MSKTYTETAQEFAEQVEARGWRSRLRFGWGLMEIADLKKVEVAHLLADHLREVACHADSLKAQRDALAENLAKMEGAHAEEVERLTADLQRRGVEIEGLQAEVDRVRRGRDAFRVEVDDLKALDERQTHAYDHTMGRLGSELEAAKVLIGRYLGEVVSKDADIGAMRQRDDQRARDNRELLKRAEVAEAGVEALKAAPMYHVIGFDYGDPSISVVELVAKVEASDDDVKPATNGSDEEPQAFKVGEYVRTTKPINFYGTSVPAGIWKVEEVRSEGHHLIVGAVGGVRRFALPSWVFIPWIPEPGDVVMLGDSPREWRVVKVHGTGIRPIELEWRPNPGGLLLSTAWADADLLTPVR